MKGGRSDLELPVDSEGPYTEALKAAVGNEDLLLKVVRADNNSGPLEDPLRVKETACYHLAKIYVEANAAEKLCALFLEMRPLMSLITRARTAKITRKLIDAVGAIPNTLDLQEKMCLETIQWCEAEQRTFLRHRVETKLSHCYLQAGKYSKCIEILTRLIKAVKQLDDKLLLVELYYLEASVYFQTSNMPKAKAALTGARTAANAVHCPPVLQADIDVLAGAIHLEDGDSATAYSYFYEPFEAYNAADEYNKALKALVYLMLSQVLSGHPKDAIGMAKQQAYLAYVGQRPVDAIVAIARAVEGRDLAAFVSALKEYADVLGKGDTVLRRHTEKLYHQLVEGNLQKLLEPYSHIQIAYVAELIRLPVETVAAKLCEMVLDKKIRGCIHQERGVLELFLDPEEAEIYKHGDNVFENLMKVASLLHRQVEKAVI